jgi:hypothetical protein
MADNTTPTVPAPTGIKYPFLTKEGKEYSNIDDLLKDLASEPYGCYLLGINSCWHGGIHISNQNEAFKHHQKDRMVRCMMDGTVVAYRLNREYPTTSWKAGDNAQEQALKYSNGFCLVKHDYVSPANKEEGANKDKTNTLTFYSLYMHLAAFSEYKQNDDSAETETGIRYILQQNRNARDTNDIQTVLGVLGKNSEVEVAENTEIESKYIERFHRSYDFVKAKIISTGSGTSPSVTVGMTIYVNSGTSNLQLKNSTPVNQHKKLEFPVYWLGEVTARADIDNMRLYATSQDCDTHAPTVFKLKKGPQQVTFDSAKQQMTSGSTKHMMAECRLPAPAKFADRLYTNSTAWMFVDQQTQLTWLKIVPTQFDSVVKCNIPIKAGDPIGFMGAWDCPADDVASGNIESMYQMHIELFSTDGEAAVTTFINNEAGLKTGKQYLQIKSGAVPLRESSGRMVTLSSVSQDAGGGVSVETVVAIDGTACKEETKNNKTYYRVTTALTVGGNPIPSSAHQVSDTYLDSSDSKVKKISQYDLAALGYQIVDEPNTSTNGYVEPDQVVTGFFKTLIEKVDTNDSKELEASEIRAAQRDPALQSTLGKIIGGHPSEWHSSTQQNIKTLFETKKATCTDTAHKNLLDFEKSRLQACEFMSQVPLEQKVWHFHPGYLLADLSDDDDSLKWLVVSKGQLTFDAEGNDIGNSRWFSRHIHWPGGASGITIGRGYDLGQQHNASRDLQDINLPEPLFSWLVQSAGLSGGDANSRFSNANNEIRQQVITRKQQHDLFEKVYTFYESEVIRISNSASNIRDYGRVDWSTTDQKIKDIFVDLRYRGDYTVSHREDVQQYLVDNDLDGLRNAISDRNIWRNVPTDRFQRRVDYLR